MENPRTHISSYYIPFHELNFINKNDNSYFTIMFNRVTEVDVVEDKILISFKCHSAAPLYGFNLSEPILYGKAVISAQDEDLNKFVDIIGENLLIKNNYPILRCPICEGLLTLDGSKNSEDILYDADFFCMDCFNAANNYFNILDTEILQQTKDSIIEQRNQFIQLIQAGINVANSIKSSVLMYHYDILTARVEFLCGNLNGNQISQIFEKYLDLSQKYHYSNLAEYINQAILFVTSIIQKEQSLKENITLEPVKENEQQVVEPVKNQDNIETPVVEDFDQAEAVSLDDEQLVNDLKGLISSDMQAEFEKDLDSALQSNISLPPKKKEPTPVASALNSKKSDKEALFTDNEPLDIEENGVLKDMADALLILSDIESDLTPKPISPLDRLTFTQEELQTLENKMKPSSQLFKGLPDLDDINIIGIGIQDQVGKKKDVWEDVEESISALDEFLPQETSSENENSNDLSNKDSPKSHKKKTISDLEQQILKKQEQHGSRIPAGLKPPPGTTSPSGINPPPGLKAPPPPASIPPGLKPPPGGTSPSGINPPPGLKGSVASPKPPPQKTDNNPVSLRNELMSELKQKMAKHRAQYE